MSSSRYNSNGQIDSNSHVVGPEENEDKTMEVNTARKQKVVVGVSSNSNTCLVVKTQEYVRRNGPILLLDGKECGGDAGPLFYLMGKEKA